MKRILLCAFALTLVACQPDDLCHVPEEANRSCLTVRVTGQLDPGAGPIDALQVDVTYGSSGDHRQLIRNTADGGAAAGLPIEFPIEFPDSVDTSSYDYLKVVALSDGKPVGYGTHDYYFKRGTHATVEVRLDHTNVSGCFDTIRDGDETDFNCGGSTCPACSYGQACSYSPSNCADLVCSYGDPMHDGPTVCGGAY